ncbi:hypothetical protein A9Q99_10060 [Gammaproteobacteria bacterium 45_16_T64]|nr:hypothetical protein A9Q99_10060 [Gammaproteobacteria bacterium 45_16_T64]
MNNDDRSSDDMIADLYQSSKRASVADKCEPSSAVDNAILGMAKEASLTRNTGEETANVVNIESTVKSALSSTKRKPNSRWAIPNSFVACLIISVTVGLIYRENADYIGLGDSTVNEYEIPYPTTMTSSLSNADNKDSEDKRMEADADEALGVMQETIVSEEVVAPMMSIQAVQAKKSKAKPIAKAKLMARPMLAPRELKRARKQEGRAIGNVQSYDTFDDESEFVESLAPSVSSDQVLHKEVSDEQQAIAQIRFDRIRHLVSGGDIEGARAAVKALLIEYPALTLPSDLAFLR